MQLLLEHHRRQLLANGARSAAGEDIDPCPVVKLFTPPWPFHALTRAEPLATPPDAGATWLLTELDPDDPDLAFGLCDLGLGCPELGTVRLSEIEALRGRLRLPVERDLAFEACGPLSAYVIAARQAERIVTDPATIRGIAAAND